MEPLNVMEQMRGTFVRKALRKTTGERKQDGIVTTKFIIKLPTMHQVSLDETCIPRSCLMLPF